MRLSQECSGKVTVLLLTAALASLALPSRAEGQGQPAMSDSLIQAGRKVYIGLGQCARCHGDQGQGTEEGVPLVSGSWKLGDGSYDWLVHVIRHAGVSARGRDGERQAMRGPALLFPDEIRAVASYVWSISRGRGPSASH